MVGFVVNASVELRSDPSEHFEEREWVKRI
jgi:hypothetical protein